jgi:hypothetical protein
VRLYQVIYEDDMKQRGRKSVMQRSTPMPAAPLMERPKPPAYFTEPEAVIWNSITEVMPPDWFGPEIQPLLARLCRHIYIAEQLLPEMIRTEKVDKGLRLKMIKSQRDETKLINSIYIRLHLTPRSLMTGQDARSKRRKAEHLKAQPKRPWDDDNEEAA